MYRTLNKYWDDPKYHDLVDTVNARVHRLMKSRSTDDLRDGMHHMVAMADARYRGADVILEDTLSRVYDVPADESHLLLLIRDALMAVAAHNKEPDNADLEAEAHVRFSEIRPADPTGITGYWQT